jgi:hypothetical protein
MANPVSGTFSDTGQSSVIVGRKIDVAMDFAGTATVTVERQMPNGSWITHASKTADYSDTLSFAANTAVRLNCTAHTDNVVYLLATGPEG